MLKQAHMSRLTTSRQGFSKDKHVLSYSMSSYQSESYSSCVRGPRSLRILTYIVISALFHLSLPQLLFSISAWRDLRH